MTYEEIVAYVQKKAAKADVKKLAPVAVQIDITGEGEGAFYVAVKDGKFEVAPFEYFDHDAKLIVNSGDFIKIVDGKLDVSEALNTGILRVEGDASKADVLKNLAAKAAKPAEKKAEPAKAASKPATKAAEKKAEPAKAAAKPATKPAEKKAEPAKAAAKPAAKAAEKKAEPAKAAAKPVAKSAPKAASKPASKSSAKSGSKKK